MDKVTGEDFKDGSSGRKEMQLAQKENHGSQGGSSWASRATEKIKLKLKLTEGF